MGVVIVAQVLLDLVVRPVEVFWRRHIGEATSDIFYETAVWIGRKSMRGMEYFSVVLEVGVDDEVMCIIIFVVLEEC